MGFLKDLFGARRTQWRAALERVRSKFTVFRALLELQNQVLKAISALEERSRKHLPLDSALLGEIQEGVRELIEKMIELGGNDYAALRQRYQTIRDELKEKGDGPRLPEPAADLVVPFDRLGRRDARAAGTKNANLGELKSRLGLPVPDGFAITTRAYRHFVDANHLQERIAALFAAPFSDVSSSEWASRAAEIRSLVLSSPVPEDLAAAIQGGYDELTRRSPGERFALRSSAIDEDTAFTFAGQYVSFLNVRRDELLSYYRKVLASQFTPAALQHLLASGLAESDLAMGVGCMAIVDAAASGVIYTRDPLNAEGEYAVVNAVFGLGSYLVEGTLTPDVFQVSRRDGSVPFSRLAQKPVRLVAMAAGGVGPQPVPEADQRRPSVAADTLRLLLHYALKVEGHYGAPQDIEWAIDRQGRLFLLQTRPLRVIQPQPPRLVPHEWEAQRLAVQGTPVCPGAGGGPVFHLHSLADLGNVPEGVVLVAPSPSPKLIAVMGKLSALVTEIGGVASHLATLTREAGLPTVAGVADAGRLPPGLVVTVDATEGKLYQGLLTELIASRRRECAPGGYPIGAGKTAEPLGRIVRAVAHLDMINPGSGDFRVENCHSFHDLIRFIHQKAIEGMFLAAQRTAYKDRIGRRLKTSVPLAVNIIPLEPDAPPPPRKAKRRIAEDDLESIPMKALWAGVLEEGWPSPPAPPDLKGFLAVMGANVVHGNQPEFSESSYAFVSREYMLLNLRMGYHFATIEALVTPDPIKNYIHMQYKDGGAPVERRVRRVRLIGELLARIGFEHSSEGDFLDATFSYQDAPAMTRCLRLLGRINIMTKQLDMALANDAVARWYTEDFIKKLGL